MLVASVNAIYFAVILRASPWGVAAHGLARVSPISMKGHFVVGVLYFLAGNVKRLAEADVEAAAKLTACGVESEFGGVLGDDCRRWEESFSGYSLTCGGAASIRRRRFMW